MKRLVVAADVYLLAGLCLVWPGCELDAQLTCGVRVLGVCLVCLPSLVRTCLVNGKLPWVLVAVKDSSSH